jgi:hypothetical protein
MWLIMRFLKVRSMCCGQVCRGEICRNIFGRGRRGYLRWSASGFGGKRLDQLQSLKTLCVDVVFVDGSLVPLHRHRSGAPKNKGPQSAGRGRKGLRSFVHMAISKKSVIHSPPFPPLKGLLKLL